MCKSKSSTLASSPRVRTRTPSSTTTTTTATTSATATTTSAATAAAASSTSTTSSSSTTSLASLRLSLPSTPHLYPFSLLSSATNNFLSKPLPSSSSAWRVTLNSLDSLLLRRPLRRPLDAPQLSSLLSTLSKSHHSSLIPLLGASLPDPRTIYIVYSFAPGSSLANCLRNLQNPNFTPLSSWLSRIQVASDIAHGLEYIHCHSSAAGGVHGFVKSSGIIVSDSSPHSFHAKICYFGAADLSGEVSDEAIELKNGILRRNNSTGIRVEGTRGYMAPELLSGGRISKQSDVYAFGVLLLEILSGEEPVRYVYDKGRRDFEKVSVVDTARAAVGEGEEGEAVEERWGRIRRWVDRRLRDSFPVEAVERLMRVALRCVEEEPAARPAMTWVAGRISKVYLDSRAWDEQIRVPTDISVSIAPR